MGLSILVKQLTIIGQAVFPGQEIHYEGANPQTLVPVLGPLPVGSRRWPNYGSFLDKTTSVSDLSKLKLTWTQARDEGGNFSTSRLVPRKSASGTLTFEGDLFQLLKQWLLDDVSAALNAVEVKIKDDSCGFFEGYVVKSNDLNWCEDGLCTFDVTLKQRDENIMCIQRTVIADNWQGWFQKVPANGKKHPRFSYCNEQRPNGTMVMTWYIAITVFANSFIFIAPLLLALNPILWLLNQIQNVLNSIPGVNVSWNIPQPINFGDIFDGMSTVFIESSGCGREHPAVLFRDYITNVCDKCGVKVDATTAPLFFDRNLNIDSIEGQKSTTNPYYNATYLYAPSSRGLRRFRRMSLLTGFQDPNDEYWVPENEPLLALDQFLDQTLPVFNHEWWISDNTLFIQRKDWYLNQPYAYDFTTNATDRQKIVKGVCYEPNAAKYPAYCTGVYTGDAADACAREVASENGVGQQNGIVSFGDVDSNPNYSGVLDKTTTIGGARFRFDGAGPDYIYDALQVVLNGGIVNMLSTGTFFGAWFGIVQQVAEHLAKYADYALLLSGETCTNPKIIIWDGIRYDNAQAWKEKAAWDGTAPQVTPEPCPVYNTTNQPWKERHYPKTDVIGRGLTFPASPNGIYRVTDYFGLVLTERPALLVNYPMYFEPFYRDTLWYYFHWVDDPRHNPLINMDWDCKIALCCDDLKHIKCLGDASGIVLGQRVKTDVSAYFNNGVILEITVSYDPQDTYGPYIELRGKM